MVRRRYRRKRKVVRGRTVNRHFVVNTGRGLTRVTRPLPSGFSNANIYQFKRHVATSVTITMNAAVTNSQGAFSFKLSDLTNYTEFTNLFDKYRIVGIKSRWMPRVNVQDRGTMSGTITESPPIYTVVDYDDASAPTDYTTLQQYENCKVHYEFKPFSLYFKPMIAVSTYNGAFTGYGSSRKMWIDAASPDVQYYSLKWASAVYSGANSGNQPVWDIDNTYYIQFKYPR